MIDLYVEHSFETQTRLADQEEEIASLETEIHTVIHMDREELNTLRDKWTLAEEEVLGLKGQKGETLHQIGQLKEQLGNQAQQLRNREEELTDLSNHVTNMNSVMSTQDALEIRRKENIARLEAQASTDQHDIAHLQTKILRLNAEISTGKAKTHLHSSSSNPESDRTSTHPIMNKEKHTLAAGVANKLLNELRRDLARTQQENTDLAQQPIKQQEGRKPFLTRPSVPEQRSFNKSWSTLSLWSP